MPTVLALLAMLGSGTISGTFFAVAVSVVPALAAMPPERYVQTHRMLGRGYHPWMPIIANVTMLSGIGLAFTAGTGTARALAGLGAALTLGVQAVSHLGNVPINRAAAAGSAGAADWPDPRPRWRALHLLRTGLATAALLAFGICATTLGR